MFVCYQKCQKIRNYYVIRQLEGSYSFRKINILKTWKRMKRFIKSRQIIVKHFQKSQISSKFSIYSTVAGLHLASLLKIVTHLFKVFYKKNSRFSKDLFLRHSLNDSFLQKVYKILIKYQYSIHLELIQDQGTIKI